MPSSNPPPASYVAATSLENTASSEYVKYDSTYWSGVPILELQALSYTAEPEIGNQIVGLPAVAWSKFTTAQLQCFTIDQVPVIPVTSLQAMNVAADGSFPFTPEQVAVLTIGQINGLLSSSGSIPAQVATFTLAQIQSLSVTEIIPKMAIGTLQAFTPSQIPQFKAIQIAALNVGTQTIPSVSNQILNLTALQVSALTADQLNALNNSQILELTSTQAHVTAITTSQIPYLKVNINSFTPTQFAFLSVEQIAALTTSATTPQVAQIPDLGNLVTALTSTQIKAFTTSQIPLFSYGTSAKTINSFSAIQIQAFTFGNTITSGSTVTTTKSQVQAFIKLQMSSFLMPSFTASQIAILSADQVSGFTTAQLDALDLVTTPALVEGQLVKLNADQVKSLKTQYFNIGPDANGSIIPFPVPVVSSDNVPLIASLSAAQIANIQNDHIYSLPSVKIQAITPLQMIAFTTTQMKQWADSNISVFTSAQISPLCVKYDAEHPEGELLSNIYTSQFQLFSSSVKVTIENNRDFLDQTTGTPQQGSVPAVPGARGALSVEQKQTLDKFPSWVTAITLTLVRALTIPLQMTYLLPSQITNLSYTQITTIKTALYNNSTYYSRDSFSAFNANILSMTNLVSIAVTSDYPPTYQLTLLDPTIPALLLLGNTLTAAKINALSAQQFRSLNPLLINTSAVSAIDDVHFSYLTLASFETLSASQVQQFTKSQLAATYLSTLFDSATKDSTNGLAVIQYLSLTQIGYLPTSIKDIVNAYIQTRNPITFNLTQFNSTDIAPQFQTNLITLGSYDEKVQFNFSAEDASMWIRYKKFNNNAYGFFTDNTYFKPDTNTYNATTCWGSKKVTNSTLTIAQNFVQFLISSLAPNSTSYKNDASKYYFKNVDTQITLLSNDINTSVNGKIHTSLDVLQDTDSTTLGTTTLDIVSQLYYTPLRGTNGDNTAIDIPTQVYETFLISQKTRLDSNVADTNGFYKMPFKLGDFIQFLLVVTANPANGGETISRTYLMELDVV